MKTIKSSIKRIRFRPITQSVLADVHNAEGLFKASLDSWVLGASIDVGSSVMLILAEKNENDEHSVTVGALFKYPSDLQEELKRKEMDRLNGGATIINQFSEFAQKAENLGFQCREECEEYSDEYYTWMWGVGLMVHVDLHCSLKSAHDESEIKSRFQLAKEAKSKMHELTANLPALCDLFQEEASRVDV